MRGRAAVLITVAAVLGACGAPEFEAPAAVADRPSTVARPSTAAATRCPSPPVPAEAGPGRWRRTELPATTKGTRLARLAEAGPSSVWAVGTSPAGAESAGLVLHWDGGRWSEQPLPAGVTAVTDVAAAGTSSAWAVGSVGNGSVLLELDGGAWRTVAAPGTVGAVAADRCGRVFVGGQDGAAPFVARRAGAGWARLPAPTAAGSTVVHHLSAAPDGRLWAGVQHPDGAQLVAWDGAGWEREAVLAGPHVTLLRLYAFAEDHVWYITNQPFVGSGHLMRPPPPNQVYAATLQPPAAAGEDPRSLELPSTAALAGSADAEWLWGMRTLARRAPGRWVPEELPAGLDPADLLAVRGAGEVWALGVRDDRPVAMVRRSRPG